MIDWIEFPDPPKRICPKCESRNTDCGRIYDSKTWQRVGTEAVCNDCGHRADIHGDEDAWYDPKEIADFREECGKRLAAGRTA